MCVCVCVCVCVFPSAVFSPKPLKGFLEETQQWTTSISTRLHKDKARSLIHQMFKLKERLRNTVSEKTMSVQFIYTEYKPTLNYLAGRKNMKI